MKYSKAEKEELEKKALSVLRVEFGRENMPVLSNMDFGHTDPRFMLPLGVEAEVNPKNRTFRLIESVVR